MRQKGVLQLSWGNLSSMIFRHILLTRNACKLLIIYHIKLTRKISILSYFIGVTWMDCYRSYRKSNFGNNINWIAAQAQTLFHESCSVIEHRKTSLILDFWGHILSPCHSVERALLAWQVHLRRFEEIGFVHILSLHRSVEGLTGAAGRFVPKFAPVFDFYSKAFVHWLLWYKSFIGPFYIPHFVSSLYVRNEKINQLFNNTHSLTVLEDV